MGKSDNRGSENISNNQSESLPTVKQVAANAEGEFNREAFNRDEEDELELSNVS
ncbi:hypothetical protein [Paenibacillus sp. tmac-D7]|uniref:hypothetical protein n=1 Tax=Paenibacillus sp. tmac-D7 TaxID=2591462 RepID=UPI0015E87126|nr:hypothetical protein [Paenibacillus sp. tmac-D7]